MKTWFITVAAEETIEVEAETEEQATYEALFRFDPTGLDQVVKDVLYEDDDE
jgi:hypothetical protein